MKALIVYYSRTGITQKVAKALGKEMYADIEEIKDTVNRKGMVGYLRSGREAMKKSLVKIKPLEKNINEYDVVIIGTPVWAFTMSSPVRTFICENKDKLTNVAFFCTMGGSGDKNTFEHMKELSCIEPVATISYKTKDIAQKNFDIKNFIEKINI
ncbi:MAG: flavodoxin family protein [bacterium]